MQPIATSDTSAGTVESSATALGVKLDVCFFCGPLENARLRLLIETSSGRSKSSIFCPGGSVSLFSFFVLSLSRFGHFGENCRLGKPGVLVLNPNSTACSVLVP